MNDEELAKLKQRKSATKRKQNSRRVAEQKKHDQDHPGEPLPEENPKTKKAREGMDLEMQSIRNELAKRDEVTAASPAVAEASNETKETTKETTMEMFKLELSSMPTSVLKQTTTQLYNRFHQRKKRGATIDDDLAERLRAVQAEPKRRRIELQNAIYNPIPMPFTCSTEERHMLRKFKGDDSGFLQAFLDPGRDTPENRDEEKKYKEQFERQQMLRMQHIMRGYSFKK